MKTSQKQVEAVVKLEGPKRYSHFIKRVVDSEQACGLYRQDWGWAIGEDDEGRLRFQLWPAREYAELNSTGLRADYTPREIRLSELIDELLPRVEGDGLVVSVFRRPDADSVTVAVPELVKDLRREMEGYE